MLGGVPVGPDERKNVKVLLTGCTAQQISPAVNERIPTFAGLMKKALEVAGAEVVWLEPHMEMDRDFVSMFDSVIVGLVSPGSLAANHMYPALTAAKAAYEHGNLSIMTDAPEPHRLWSGIISVVQNPGSLIKPFYARRRAYEKASTPETYESLQGFLGALAAQEWPTTIAPSLPWSARGFLSRHIAPLQDSQEVGLCLDKGLDLPITNPLTEIESRQVWLADDPSSPWITKLSKTISFPIEPLRLGRADTIIDLASRAQESSGVLITTYRGGESWWSPAIRLSLLQKVPVVSDWRVTEPLGEPWSHLAAGVESLDSDSRAGLAKAQMDTYDSAVPDFEAEASRLVNLLDARTTKKPRKKKIKQAITSVLP